MIEQDRRLQSAQEYFKISEKDPLDLDDCLMLLPEHNSVSDSTAIQIDLNYAVSNYLQLKNDFSSSEAIAALRDMDFLCASLSRHGINPIESTAYLDQSLIQIASIAKTVPRGTVYTYGLSNPNNNRRRTFSGTDEENSFIDAVQHSSLALEAASYSLSKVVMLENSINDVTDALSDVVRGCTIATESIVDVHRNVSPSFFTNTLRPFFEPLLVGGREYMGAGGAQMQLLSIERMIWGIDDQDTIYQHYYDENVEYLDHNQRELVKSYSMNNDAKSILTHARIINDTDLYNALAPTLRAMRKFRYPHKKVADNNFEIRSKDSVGSGSFQPSILGHLIMKVESYMEEVTLHENKF